MQYGRQLLSVHSVFPTRVSADGNPKYKAGGIRLNLATLAAAPVADVTLPDGSVIKANQGRYLRYGQILTMLGTAEVQTVTVAGGASSGTFTLTLPASGDDPAQTTVAIAWNDSAANMATALNNLPRISARGAVTVSVAGGVYTITFPKAMGNPPQLTNTNSTNGTVTNATTTAGLATNGEYGPYDDAATDGRQLLVRGDAFILDETWLEFPAGPSGVVPESNIIIGSVFEGGDVWKRRLIVTSGVHSLAAGPTFAEFETLFPRVSYVQH